MCSTEFEGAGEGRRGQEDLERPGEARPQQGWESRGRCEEGVAELDVSS